MYGIDPAFDQADEKISWEDYEPTQDFNVFRITFHRNPGAARYALPQNAQRALQPRETAPGRPRSHCRKLCFRRALPLDVPIEMGARGGDDGGDEAEGSAALQPRWEALLALTAAEADRGFEAAYAALCAKLRRHNDEQDAAVRAAAAAAAARPTPPLPPRLRLAASWT